MTGPCFLVMYTLYQSASKQKKSVIHPIHQIPEEKKMYESISVTVSQEA